MSHDKKFNNESQDARRRDIHNEVHPSDKKDKKQDKVKDGKTSENHNRK